MDWLSMGVWSIVYALVYLVPVVIVVMLISHLYNTRQNTKYIIKQNQEMIELLKDIKAQNKTSR